MIGISWAIHPGGLLIGYSNTQAARAAVQVITNFKKSAGTINTARS